MINADATHAGGNGALGNKKWLAWTNKNRKPLHEYPALDTWLNDQLKQIFAGNPLVNEQFDYRDYITNEVQQAVDQHGSRFIQGIQRMPIVVRDYAREANRDHMRDINATAITYQHTDMMIGLQHLTTAIRQQTETIEREFSRQNAKQDGLAKNYTPHVNVINKLDQHGFATLIEDIQRGKLSRGGA